MLDKCSVSLLIPRFILVPSWISPILYIFSSLSALRQIKTQLQDFAQVGKSFLEVDALATKLIVASGGKPNFSLVPGYHHTTCINRNQGIVHGIPNQTIIESGDLISIDFGMLYQGWNLDTSISFIAGQSNPSLDNFLSVGKKALAKAIAVAIAGNNDISFKIEKTITKPDKTDSGSEFFDEEQSSIGRKIAAVEVNFDLLIAFKRNGV